MTQPIFVAIPADLGKDRSADLERALIALHAVFADVQQLDEHDRQTFAAVAYRAFVRSLGPELIVLEAMSITREATEAD